MRSVSNKQEKTHMVWDKIKLALYFMRNGLFMSINANATIVASVDMSLMGSPRLSWKAAAMRGLTGLLPPLSVLPSDARAGRSRKIHA